MNKKMMTSMALAALCAVGTGSAAADPVYAHPGTVNGASYTFEAIATGDVYAYFMSESAAYTEVLGMSTASSTTPIGAVGLNNQTSHRGQFIDLGHVTAGEILTFYIKVANTGLTFSSQKSLNADGTQHIYSTSYTGSVSPTIPNGTYISFEDLTTKCSDHDYNDTAFVVTDVRAVPEPAGLALMLGGLALVGAAVRRRRAR